MKKIQRLGLIAFTAYLPILTLIISWLGPSLYHGFSLKTHWISNLGERHSSSYFLFVVSINILAILGIFPLLQLKKLLPKSPLGQLTIFSLGLSLICFFLVILYPLDTQIAPHTLFAFILFPNLIIFNSLMTYWSFKKSNIPNFLAIFNLGTVIFTIIFLISTFQLMQKYPFLSLKDMTAVIKIEKSFLIKWNAVLEWLLFYCQIIWAFLIGILLLFHRKTKSRDKNYKN